MAAMILTHESNPAPATCDALIVGAGPAGLTAAIYLARFRRAVVAIDKGEGRLAMIPRSHNHAGFPGGVPGPDLLARMAEQAALHGADLRKGETTALARAGEGFLAQTTCGPIRARAVILATGVVNARPPLPAAVHDDALARGLLRYCPICDAYEEIDRRIGVLGGDRHALAEAMFLTTYSRHVSLIAPHALDLDAEAREAAARAGIALIGAGVAAYDFSGDVARLALRDGREIVLDTLYAALGSRTRNELGARLGVRLVEGQCFATDAFQRTTIDGLYAAGDAVEGLDQISSAMGTGARAAVTLHNDLRARDGQTLEE
jgi:thioredoxin reductase (NADPH)